MRNKTLRNCAAALSAFVFWGSITCLLLPVDDYSTVAETVIFVAGLFALVVLIVITAGMAKDSNRNKKQ